MNNLLAFSDILQISGVTAVIFSAFLIATLGYLLGKITIKGVNLGTAGVFLVAILAGVVFAIPALVEVDFLNNFYLLSDKEKIAELSLKYITDKQMLKVIGNSTSNMEVYGTIADIGLILFVTSVGFIAGPSFFKNLRANAKSYVTLGVIIILSGVLVAVVFALLPGIGAEYSIGVLSGALTSTPAFSAAKEVASDEALVALGHAVAYPFGVVGVVLFVQLMPKFLKTNREEEIAKMQSINTGAKKVEQEEKLFEIDEFGLAVFGVAVVLGLILGKLTLTISGLKFSLGSTGGPLIMALILGHFGRVGKISLKIPEKTLKVFREFGLVLFLIGAGVEGGVSLLEKINAGTFSGLTILWGFIAGVIMTIVPMVIGFIFAKKVLKLPLFNNLGSITGGMTSTPALGTLVQVSGTDDVAGAYASTYPVALVLIVIASNLVITLIG
ncbi:MAG: permease [Clostridiales bacterium]|nr:permease [Clostridiales bacterium]